MRSIQSIFGCYTTERFRWVVAALAFGSACMIVPPSFLLSHFFWPQATADDNWFSVLVALAVVMLAGVYILYLTFESIHVSVEDLAALPAELRPAVQAQLANPMTIPLDWSDLRKLGDKQAMEAFDERQRKLAQADIARRRNAVQEGETHLAQQRDALQISAPQPEQRAS